MADFKNQADLAIPKGSLILITGANGYLASNIVTETLAAGYRVRGTVRSQAKADESLQLFASAGPSYEVVVVPSGEAPGAFDAAVRGVDAIIHTASPVNMSPDPKEVVVPAVAVTVGVLRSALTEPRVRAFVYTSSGVTNGPGVEQRVDSGTWDHDIAARFSDYPPPYRAEDAMKVYAASKIRAEEAVWEFERQEKPHFRINTVLPDLIMGRIVGPSGMSAGAILDALEGKVPEWLPPCYMIDVVDTARVHLIAAVDGSVAGERILNYGYPFNFNDVLDLVRELRPGSRLPDNNPALGRDLRKVDNARGAELLKKWYGQNGWTSLKESVIQNIKGRD